ncbi:MAG TPA: imelysin family protein [Candidatus Kapabacteria bacterium]|nr:imelysin family protein [Candidatus Kapabacteria bacterium]
MKLRKYHLTLAISGLLGLSLLTTGCKNTVTPPPTSTWDQTTSDVLKDLTNNVIIPTFRDFDTRVGELQTAINTLKDQPNEQNLQAARDAWKRARHPWEAGEAYIFGPASSMGIDPAVDSWPLDENKLQSTLDSNEVLDKTFFDNSEGTVKGAHAVEFLLWGNDGTKTASALTPRELDYMVGCMLSFKGATETLLKAWVPASEGGSDFGSKFYMAGKEGSTYSTQVAAVGDALRGMARLMDELNNSKMGIPFTNQNLDFEEARFSSNSKADFIDNVLGVQSMYLGTYSTFSGKGFTVLVHAKDAALDSSVTAQLTDALTKIQSINPTFGDAVTNSRNSIQTARFSVSEINRLVGTNVIEALGIPKQ